MGKRISILGAGMTGLSAGMASGFPVYEAESAPGGICSSYYVRPGSSERLHTPPADDEAYRFEIGGGHWIFGGDPFVIQFINSLAPTSVYYRKSSVYFHKLGMYVPYPLQNHLFSLGKEISTRALAEMAAPSGPISTMRDWLRASFGDTLSDLFFEPFHDLYTAGLHHEIAPQDSYKSPVNLATALKGAFEKPEAVGYNVSFLYPKEGLNALALRMAERCDVRYGKKIVKIDTSAKVMHFEDGGSEGYDTLISTLPLDLMMELTGLDAGKPDPSTAVLVLNIGAVRGPKCPEDHWLYNPDAQSGFHRVGFYSNVDTSFLPASQRATNSGVSIYVERAYRRDRVPSEAEIKAYGEATVKELQEWGYIGECHVCDPTWISAAYTWTWPGSSWKARALKALEQKDIMLIGRYSRWMFQGIADSIRDGFYAGAAAKHW